MAVARIETPMVILVVFLLSAIAVFAKGELIRSIMATSPATLKWCIVGAGDVCEKKAAPAAFRSAGENCIVASVVRRNLAKGEDFSRRHGISRAYASFEEMIEQDEQGINAIYIATPPSSHFEYAKLSLEAGIKQIYLEKPVTMDAREARLLKAEIEKHGGAKLVVAHYRNSLPMFKFVHSLITDKLVGEIRTVTIREIRKEGSSTDGNWRLDPSVSGGGLFHDIAPHALALVQLIFGDAEDVSGISMRQADEGPEDLVTGLYRLPGSGASITMTWCFSAAEGEEVDECLVTGSEGSISFPFYTGTDVTVTLRGERSEEHSRSFTHPEHIQSSMIGDATRFFRGEAENPCSIDEAIKVMTIMDALTGKKAR